MAGSAGEEADGVEIHEREGGMCCWVRWECRTDAIQECCNTRCCP